MIGQVKNEIASYVNKLEYLTDETLSSLMDSPYASISLFGIEMEAGSSDVYLITPATTRLTPPSETVDWESYLSVHAHDAYSIRPLNKSFLPLHTDSVVPFIHQLKKLRSESVVIFQFIFQKRTNGWKPRFEEQYIHYLNGEDNPSTNPLLRTIQSKTIDLLNRVSSTERDYRNAIPEIEEKILDTGYRWEGRIWISGKTKEDRQSMANKVEMMLEHYDHLNGLRLVKIKQKKPHYLMKEFTKSSEEYVLSGLELRSFLTEVEAQEALTPVPVKEEEVPAFVVDVSAEVMDRIELLDEGEKKEGKIDEKLGKQLEDSLERVGLGEGNFELLTAERGPVLQRMQYAIPSTLKYSNLKKEVENLQVAFGSNTLSMEPGNQPGSVAFSIPCADTTTVHLGHMLREPDFHYFASKAALPFVVGTDILGHPIYGCLSKMVHLLVAGTTGSGKSVWVRQLSLTLMIMKEPRELHLYMIDPKQVEFSCFASFPHVKEVITDMRKAEYLLAALVDEMEDRYTFLKDTGYRDIISYNNDHPTKKKAFIVCVIDEFSDLVQAFPDVSDYVQRLGQKARGAGIHLIVATQFPKAEILNTTIKAVLPSVVCFNLKLPREYQVVFGSGIPYTLLGNGDGVSRTESNGNELERFQGAVIDLSQKKERKIMDKISGMYTIVEDTEESLEIKEDVDILLKLKRIIKTTKETRVGNLQKLMKIRQNDIGDLMAQLVEEGFLFKHAARSKGYELIATEEELAELEDWDFEKKE